VYKIRKLVKYFYLKNKNIGKKSKKLFRIKIPILISISTIKNDKRLSFIKLNIMSPNRAEN
jgi:hypothetical protein